MKKTLSILLLMMLFAGPALSAQVLGTVNNIFREQLFMPTGEITNVDVINDEVINVEYNLYDKSNLLLDSEEYSPKLILFQDNEIVSEKDISVGEGQNVEIDGLELETEYKLILSGPFDALGQGQPSNKAPYELDSISGKIPDQKEIPVANIHLTTDENPTILNEDSIELHYDVVDNESALLDIGTIGLRIVVQDTAEDSIVYVGSGSAGNNVIENIVGLEAGKSYDVTILGQYDLNEDGVTDNKAPYILDSELFYLSDPVDPVDPPEPEDSIGISTCKDLESIGQGENYPGATHSEAWYLNGNYFLTQNIDCSATNPNNPNHDTTLETTYEIDGFTPIGTENNPFTGNFDGKDKTIDGMYISNKGGTGLFGYVCGSTLECGEIQNVGLTNVDMQSKGHIGALAGTVNNTTVKNSYSTGKIDGDYVTGGLVGEMKGTLENSYSSVDVKGYDGYNVGGLTGVVGQTGHVINCYATGKVTGNYNNGGLSGYIYGGTVENSYASGTVNEEYEPVPGALIYYYSGGLVGYSNRGNIINSYSTSDVNGMNLSGLLAGGQRFVVTNSYRYAGQLINDEIPKPLPDTVTKEQLLDPSWYTDVLKFDSNWNLEPVENGYHPHLMKSNLSEEVAGQENIVID